MNETELEVDEYLVTITLLETDGLRSLNEGHYPWKPLTGPWAARHDSPRGYAKAQHHLHLFNRGAEVCAVNIDGSGHDGSHGFQLPNKVADAIRLKYPKWTIPQNNIIESVNAVTDSSVLARNLADCLGVCPACWGSGKNLSGVRPVEVPLLETFGYTKCAACRGTGRIKG